MANTIVRAFSVGEIAPALYARTDQARYEVALRTCRNFLVMRQGGATKRPGTEFLTEVEDSSVKVRLIPFVFNVRQSFVLEFGNLYVRFIQNGGQVLDPDDNTIPLEIVSPYVTADLPGLQYVQSGDVVTIVHPSYPPYELVRHSNTTWGLNAIVFGPTLAAPTISSVTGGDPATSKTASYILTRVGENGEESLGSAPVTCAHPPTPTTPTFIEAVAAGAETFRLYRQDAGSGVYGFVGEGIGDVIEWFDYGTIPEVALQPPIDRTLFASEDNYPSVVAYYQQRLIFANSNTNPDTVWASRTGYFHNFTVSAITQDDDAITFRIVSDEVDAVRHLLNLGRLVVGTEGADWIIEGDGNGVLTPISINPRAGSYDGMAALKPIKSGARMLFLQALGSAVRELTANVQFGDYSLVGGDVTLFSSHLVDGYSITDWAFQQEPLHVVWMVRSDGVMLGMTYIPEQQMLAWHRHDTDGWVENVCVVPEGRYHWLYLVVRRIIDGETRRYIERMSTTNVTPLFATPEEAATAPGGIITPPPPPPAPGPSDSAVSPPTSPATTDIGTTGATVNWVAGNILAPTEVGYRLTAGTDLDWTTTTVDGGIQSLVISGLTVGSAYLWRARHNLSGAVSSYTGPTAFSTLAATAALTAPTSAPSITDTVAGSGFTDITIAWPASTQTASSEVGVAGPQSGVPVDDDFNDIGTFSPGVTSATDRITASGTYWLRVRYTKSGFDPSSYAGPSSFLVSVVP